MPTTTLFPLATRRGNNKRKGVQTVYSYKNTTCRKQCIEFEHERLQYKYLWISTVPWAASLLPEGCYKDRWDQRELRGLPRKGRKKGKEESKHAAYAETRGMAVRVTNGEDWDRDVSCSNVLLLNFQNEVFADDIQLLQNFQPRAKSSCQSGSH